VLIIVVAVSIPLVVTTLLFLATFANRFMAQRHIEKMRHWDVPPQTQILDFKLLHSHGPAGNTCFIDGTLILNSNLSEDTLTDFYTSRYHPAYFTPTYYDQIKAIATNDRQYHVSTGIQYYCL